MRALAINAGIANAGTLAAGMADARQCCKLTAKILGCRAREVLPFSTGVIMERLPMERYASGLKLCAQNLQPQGWLAAARAMMTTDTVAKAASKTVAAGKSNFAVTGIAKGSGMIHPNMATMLAFAATDAAIPAPLLQKWQREIAAETFNAISVDGDTSTNDSFLLIATGAAGTPSRQTQTKLRNAISEVCAHLANAIVRDGEGAKKILTITVARGRTPELCRKVAESVARSPLVKTALAAGDANVGRLLMAIGNAGGGFNPNKITVTLGAVPVVRGGGLDSRYAEKAAAKEMQKKEIRLEILLNNGAAKTVLATCDLTHGYITINADYRS